MANETSAEPSGNQRDTERVPTTAAVEFGNALWPRKGVTRDISPSGLFIETDAIHRIDNIIAFSVELDTPQGRMVLSGCGEVVRIEPRAQKVGIAIKITESSLHPASVTAPPADADNGMVLRAHSQ